MSTAPTLDERQDPEPFEHGWVSWTDITEHRTTPTLAVFPRHGHCSVTGCLDLPVAAITRRRAGRRPPYWQPYCRAHASARGVDENDGRLSWQHGFEPATNVRRERRPLSAE
jgi:hypothetical protein